MQATEDPITSGVLEAQKRAEDELAALTAHINAATARWLELVSEFQARGCVADGDFVRWLAFRCGVTAREAREYVRVADALRELPSLRAAFSRGELTFSKVLSDDLKIMDAAAVALCRDNNIPIVVFNVRQSGNLAEVLSGRGTATIVQNGD